MNRLATVERKRVVTRPARATIRSARAAEAPKLHALISANLEEGHLLPRTLEELVAQADRFVVAVKQRRIVACAELMPLSSRVAEVRSLVVAASERGTGVGGMLVDELRRRAAREGFEQLCAFTHTPGYFSRMGFSIVPHLWIPEKVTSACVQCPLFRRCGQYAMITAIEPCVDSVEPVRRDVAACRP